jgi:hypothetical protein
MKGYCYLDWDKNFVFKDRGYIDTVNPGFWQDHSMLIQKVWKIDTEIPDTIKQCFVQAQERGVTTAQIKDMCKALRFDLNLIVKK